MYEHFPPPAMETLPVFGELQIVIRQRLTVGEERRARKRLYATHPTTGAPIYDPTMTGLTTVLAYLLDWNLTRGGQKVEIRAIAMAAETDPAKVGELQTLLEQLDPATYDAIEDVILRYEAEQDRVRAAAKKSTGGGLNSGSTSSSPSGPAGVSNTSADSHAMTTS